MTKKLYYDPRVLTCEATVLACRAHENLYEILLDQTVIYPEGGGQPSDTGEIDGARVSYAFEDGHNIWHRCDQAFALGTRVRVRFDEDRRRDHSRQHTGEHILSGLAASLFGCVNVGFHMAEDYVSVDFDLPLSPEQVRALAFAVNEAVQRDEEISERLVDASELPGIALRKCAKGLEGEVRIIYAGSSDSCTCCGTHCVRTGEVGVVKILSHMNYKGGTRLFFLCGMRAVRAMMEDAAILDSVARRFSTKPQDVMPALVKQGDELSEARRALKKRTEALFTYKARELYEAAPKAGKTAVVVYLGEELAAAELGLLGEKICALGSAVVLLMSENGTQLAYRLARSGDVMAGMRELCAAVNAATGGKGGGREDSAQGSAPARADAQEIRAQLEAYIVKWMHGMKSR